jgi:cobalt/nickel transport system permease protein
VQLLLLYRYLFVLMEEGARMLRAHALRSAGGGRVPLRVFGSLAGQLLVRALDRAQRLHVAMLCRGFDGEFRLARPLRFRLADLAFVMAWFLFCLLCRQFNAPRLLGEFLLRIFP